MTPEQLSDAIVHALTTLTERGDVTLPDGVPSAVVVERPKVREHGDYATNVALQLGKKAGMAPRDLAGLLAKELESADGIASRRHRRPGLPQHRGRRRQPGVGGGRRRRGRGVVRQQRPVRRREGQPRVRLRQPDRAAAHRRHPLGGGRRRAGPGLLVLRRPGHPRVLLQRPRRPDRPVLPLAAGQRARPGRARGRVRRRLHLRDRHRRPEAAPRHPRAARRRGARRSSARSAST